MRPRMHRKQYENAARIVQQIVMPDARHYAMVAFAEFFSADNPAFSEERFAAACVPGANVKARVRE